MEKFFSLRAEKQEHIINAALTVFARNGYKKTSTADIAEAAGIAKGMIFYYFGSKKSLYLYLVNLCGKTIVEELEKRFDRSVTDYFGRMRMITEIKMSAMKKYPATMLFLTSVFYETDPEVTDDLKKHFAESGDLREMYLLDKLDDSKFKEDVDPKLVEKFLTWASEGMANALPLSSAMDDVNAYVDEFYKILDIMEKYFYKEEHLQ